MYQETTRNVRGISDANWKWLRMLAAFQGRRVGELLDDIIDEWANQWRAPGPNSIGQALERQRVAELDAPVASPADGATSGRPRSPRKLPARPRRQPR